MLKFTEADSKAGRVFQSFTSFISPSSSFHPSGIASPAARWWQLFPRSWQVGSNEFSSLLNFFCACPLTSSFLTYTQMHINWIFPSSVPAVESFPPEGTCQIVVAFKVIANSKSQTALLLLHSSENAFMKSDSGSSWAALTQLLCSLCLILMSALGISLFLLIYNRLRPGRRTPK